MPFKLSEMMLPPDETRGRSVGGLLLGQNAKTAWAIVDAINAATGINDNRDDYEFVANWLERELTAAGIERPKNGEGR